MWSKRYDEARWDRGNCIHNAFKTIIKSKTVYFHTQVIITRKKLISTSFHILPTSHEKHFCISHLLKISHRLIKRNHTTSPFYFVKMICNWQNNFFLIQKRSKQNKIFWISRRRIIMLSNNMKFLYFLFHMCDHECSK